MLSSGLPTSKCLSPPWLYRSFDAAVLTGTARTILSQMQEWLLLKDDAWRSAFAGDYTRFTYWLCANIPASDVVRMGLLATDCANSRLQHAVQLLQAFQKSTISCASCMQPLSLAMHVFTLSTEGFMSSYVNPNGLMLALALAPLLHVHIQDMFIRLSPFDKSPPI